MTNPPKIKRGQIYKSISKRGHGGGAPIFVEVFGKSGDYWKTRMLTNKKGVYSNTHTFIRQSLERRFVLFAENINQIDVENLPIKK